MNRASRRASTRAAMRLAALVLLTAAACSSTPTSTAPATTATKGTTATSTTGSTPPGTNGTRPGTTSPSPPPVATMTGEREVSGAYRQGLARFGDGWIFSTNVALYRTDDAITEGVKNEAAIPADWLARGYNHIGDIDIVDGVVYAPVEQPDYDLGKQAVLRFDAATLRFLGAVEVAQHHNAFVSVDPATHVAYSADQFTDRALVRYDVDHDWAVLPPLPLTREVGHIQGGDLGDGAFWLSTDDDGDGLYRVDLASGQTDRVGSLGHPEGEGEGIDATPLPSGLLHAISIDPKLLPVFLEHFRVA